VPTPNPAHTAGHKRRNIRSYGLATCYGLHQKTSFVSSRPHSSAHSGDSSTQRPTLPSWPSIRSFTWRGLETLSWSSSRSLDRPSPQRHWICSCQPLETGHTGPWWSDASPMTSTTTRQTSIDVEIASVSRCAVHDCHKNKSRKILPSQKYSPRIQQILFMMYDEKSRNNEKTHFSLPAQTARWVMHYDYYNFYRCK